MKRIALITFHNAANYGAILQTYALQKALENNGFSSVYINYQNTHRANAYNMFYIVFQNLKNKQWKSALLYFLGSPFMYLRKLRFRRWAKNNINITAKVYTSYDDLAALNEDYDKFIVGSDQVWNYENNGSDFAFLLDFVKEDNKKISYSSSFGLNIIPADLVDKYRDCLLSIKYLSVRESEAVNIIKKITGRNAELVLDPVFLISQIDWLSLCYKISEKFVFSYTNRVGQFESFISSTGLDMSNYKHYKLARATFVRDFFNTRIRVKYSMSPIDFISVINSASLIVTASFHCVSLSIILNRPFVVILTGDEGKDNRILSILSLLGLENRIFSPNMTINEVFSPIDYNSVNRKINILRDRSFSFLMDSIMSDL